ncbi:MAG: GtrA family protein [Candidatus Heimdallarchaeota archaeon]
MSKLFAISPKRMIPYLLISVLATAVDLGSFLLLLNILDWHYLIANMLSIVFGILTKFSLNRFITFKDRIKRKWQQQFQRFLIVSGSGFVLSNLVLVVLIEILEISEPASKVVTIGIVFIYTFILHNLYSFN